MVQCRHQFEQYLGTDGECYAMCTLCGLHGNDWKPSVYISLPSKHQRTPKQSRGTYGIVSD